MKSFSSIIFISILAVFVLLGCQKKCDDSSGRRFIVQSPMLVTPQAKEIMLGDTLTLTIEVPYNNKDVRNSEAVAVGSAKMSEFGIDFRLLNRSANNTLVGGGRELFKIIMQNGLSRGYTESRLQNQFSVEGDRYVYVAKIIPLQKGLVNLVNYRAEAKQDCRLIDLSPICINNPNNHDLYYDFSRFLGASDYIIPDNHYYVWVR